MKQSNPIKTKKNQKIEVDYKKKIIDLLEKKYSYFALGMSVLVLAIYFSFKFNLVSFKNTPKKQSSPQIKKPASVKKENFYQVQEGDTLWSIAEKFYGSGFNMEDIMKANKIIDANIIEKGQLIIIPSIKPKQPTQGEIDTNQTNNVKYSESFYIVQPGEDLWQIALKTYGDSYAWPRIAEANKIVDPNNIEVGTKLIIPR